MAKRLLLIFVATILLSTVACVQNTGEERDGESPAVLKPLSDGEWELRVDRVFYVRPGVAHVPSDTLTEADFRSIAEGPTYEITVSGGQSQVLIHGVLSEGDLAEGYRTAVTDGSVEYDLGEIAGGGRLVVWSTKEAIQAELAVYGYGMPFLRCVRGALVPLQ